MVYVPPAIHRAIRQVALDEGRPASDVYVEAVRALLSARGMEVTEEPEPHGSAPSAEPTLADLVAAVDGLGARIDEALGRGAVDGAASAAGKRPQAGTKEADAVAVLLGLLRGAGPDGLSGLPRACGRAA